MKDKISQIKGALMRHKTLVSNFGYLSVLQVVTFAIPLLTLPYLLKVLGKETYGLVVFAQTIIQYFVIIVSFGFNISATKDIASNKDDKAKVSEILSSVYIAKGTLFLLSFLVLMIIANTVPSLENHRALLYFSMYSCLYEWLFPLWYFRGIEKMRYITILNVVSRLIFLSLIFLFVRDIDDYIFVPVINGVGAMIASVIALFLVFRKHNNRLYFPTCLIIWGYVKGSIPVFLGSFIGRAKVVSNKAILGAFVGMESVAVFDIADKIRLVIQSFLDNVVVVLFPNISKSKSASMVKKTVRLLFAIGVVAYVCSLIAIALGVRFYVPQYEELPLVYALVGGLIFIQSTSYLIGTSVMIVNGLDKAYTMSLVLPTILYFSLMFVFYLSDNISIYTISMALLLSMIYELVYRVFSCSKHNLKKWIF